MSASMTWRRVLAVGTVGLGIWLVAAAARAAQLPAPTGAPVSGAQMVLRMSEALVWPDRFDGVVRLEPATPAAGASATAMRVHLEGRLPDSFHWWPAGNGPEVVSGVAWQGWVEIARDGPGPRFSYSYDGLPFLDVLRVYLGIFRPLPEGSRLELRGSRTVARRAGVEGILTRSGGSEQARLVIDRETGLILEAAVLRGGAAAGHPGETGGTEAEQLLVRAGKVEADRPGGLTQVVYQAPVLGSQGSLTVAHRQGFWFPVEAVIGGDHGAHRVRFEELRLGEASPASVPDTARLRQLRALLDEADQAFTARRYGQAAAAYRRALTIDPYNLNARNRLGNAAMKQGDWLVAESEFAEVVQLAPELPVGYNNLAFLYTTERTRLGTALSLARRAMELSGDHPDVSVLDTYGWVLFHQGQLEESLATLRRAVEQPVGDPRDRAEVYYHLGIVLARMSQVGEARHYLRLALEADPELQEAREALAGL